MVNLIDKITIIIDPVSIIPDPIRFQEGVDIHRDGETRYHVVNASDNAHIYDHSGMCLPMCTAREHNITICHQYSTDKAYNMIVTSCHVVYGKEFVIQS